MCWIDTKAKLNAWRGVKGRGRSYGERESGLVHLHLNSHGQGGGVGMSFCLSGHSQDAKCV